jgi:hypothetical protein
MSTENTPSTTTQNIVDDECIVDENDCLIRKRDNLTVKCEEADIMDDMTARRISYVGKYIRGYSDVRGSHISYTKEAGFSFQLLHNKQTIIHKENDSLELRSEYPTGCDVLDNDWWRKQTQNDIIDDFGDNYEDVDDYYEITSFLQTTFSNHVVYREYGDGYENCFYAIKKELTNEIETELFLVEELGEKIGHEFVWV